MVLPGDANWFGFHAFPPKAEEEERDVLCFCDATNHHRLVSNSVQLALSALGPGRDRGPE